MRIARIHRIDEDANAGVLQSPNRARQPVVIGIPAQQAAEQNPCLSPGCRASWQRTVAVELDQNFVEFTGHQVRGPRRPIRSAARNGN